MSLGKKASLGTVALASIALTLGATVAFADTTIRLLHVNDNAGAVELWKKIGSDFEAENAKSLHLVDTADLDAVVPVPHDIPWFPKNLEAWSVRWVILHVINELTRHSGHADIIRESIDGATMYELLAGLEGWEIAGWVTPWGKPERKHADS